MLTSREGSHDERAEGALGLGEHQETAHEVSELSGFVHRARPPTALRADHLLSQNERRTMVVERARLQGTLRSRR